MIGFIQEPYQEWYEKSAHKAWEDDKVWKQGLLMMEVDRLMAERGDYKAYYYSPINARYFRATRKIAEDKYDDSDGGNPAA